MSSEALPCKQVQPQQQLPITKLLLIVLLAVGLVSCSNSSALTKAQIAKNQHEKYIEQQKREVIAVWENATRTYFHYTQQGPPTDLQTLLDTGSGNSKYLTPGLQTYDTTNKTLRTFSTIFDYWNLGVRGPKSYSLGTPQVYFLNPSTAELFSCTSMLGWKIPSSPPPSGVQWPVNGNGYATSTVIKKNGIWYVSSRSTYGKAIPGYSTQPTVPKC